jgi:hypothetical protein
MNVDSIQYCYDLGAWLAENNVSLMTGACSGVPYYVGKGAVDNGGRVIGYSPAVDNQEHLEKFDFPTDGCSEIYYLEGEYSKNDAFLIRSMQMMEASDLVISLYGNWGTLNELVFSVFSGKKIITAAFLGGASDIFSGVFKTLDSQGAYHYGAKLLVANTVHDLKSIIKEELPAYV